MNEVFRARRLFRALACAALIVLGCGGGAKGVKLEGKLERAGTVFAVGQGQNLSLSFVGQDASGQNATYVAKVNSADGSFVVEGVNGRGIPPGKYKVRISLTTGSTDPASLNKIEKDNEEFAAIQGKECDISSQAVQKMTIDVIKGQINKS